MAQNKLLSRANIVKKYGGKQLYFDPENTPPEMMIETMERQIFPVQFDNCILTLELTPGREYKNAVIVGWKNPIRAHDGQVLEVERLETVAQYQEREYKQKLRTFKNWESGWMLMNTKPDELEEYEQLKKDMEDFHTRLKFIRTPEEKIEMEEQWNRFATLKGRSENLLLARATMEMARRHKDQALQTMLQAAKDFEDSKEKEKEMADQISEDHVEADQRGVGIPELFPTINIGYIVTRVNGRHIEDMLFTDILVVIEEAKPPHKLELRRYDYRQNELSGRWESLHELRLDGKFVEDPRVKRQLFVDAGRRGDVQDLSLMLVRGEDINAMDSTHSTAFHHAAANGHFDAMELLLEKGADIELRDHNMETPLLHAARRGDIKVVQFLLDHRANIDIRDRNFRTALFHAIMASNIDLVNLIIERRTALNLRDKYWKWTPLHYAASVGSTEIVGMLLGRRASPYLLSEHGWTPQRCAEENSCHAVAEMLREYIFNEPAQCVLPGKGRWTSIWFGKQAAAEVRWCSDRGFKAVLTIYKPKRKFAKHLWMKDNDQDILWMKAEVAAKDDDTTPASWENLLAKIPEMIRFVDRAMDEGRELLITDDTGISTSMALIIVHILIKRRVRLDPAIEQLVKIRRQAKLSESHYLGLKELQDELDQRKLDRLEDRLRTSAVLSVGF